MIDGGSKAERDERVRQRLAETSPEGAPPPPRWRKASWALLLVVFLILAGIAAAAGWAVAGRTGAIIGVALAVFAAAVRGAPVLIADGFRRGERKRAQAQH
jgi:hypothetical protein